MSNHSAPPSIFNIERDIPLSGRKSTHRPVRISRATSDMVSRAAVGGPRRMGTFLLASSAEVYGLSFQSGLPLAEDAPLRPANPYAAAKAAADLAVGEMALRGLRSIRLRAFNHVGAGQGEGFVVAGFAAQLRRIERGAQPPTLRVGALDRWRDFLDVRDICAAYTLALRADLPPGTVLNIASGTPRRIGEVLDALLDRVQVRPAVEIEATRLRPTDVERVQGDAEQAERILRWRPSIPWEETLDAVMEDAQRRAVAL